MPNNNIDNKLLSRKKDMEQALSLKMMEKEFETIHNIYFDLAVLQDLNIGTLLLHTKDEIEYKRILSCIPVYLSRIEPAICKYFPSISLTDEDIKKYILDRNNAEMLYKASPHTDIWFMLPHIFKRIYERNRMVDRPERFRCNMYLNVYGTGYNQEVCKIIRTKISRINNKITLHIINKPIHELSQGTRITPDIYFVEDIGNWISTDSVVSREFYQDLLYEDKQFFSKRMVTATDVTVPVIEAFNKSRDFMRTFTAFEYMDVSIPNVQYVPPVIENDPSDKIVS